jgi:hypothetical protein
MDDIIDIVIPVGPNDLSVIHTQLQYTKKNIINRRNIYIISNLVREDISGVIFIPESIFPFSKQSVADIHGADSRNGWYLQQLLKFYAGFCVPGILPNYLVLDADTFFLRPTKFLEDGITLFNSANEYWPAYFEHMQSLHSSLNKIIPYSGICHHMLFTTKYVKELIDLVENEHKSPFWKVFLEKVVERMRCGEFDTSGASEYEMYITFMTNHHSDTCMIRHLKWKNSKTLEVDNDYDYVSIHWYERELA